MKKKISNTDYSDTVPVFRLIPKSSARLVCSHIGYAKIKDDLVDQPYEFDEKDDLTGSNVLVGIGSFGDYAVCAKGNVCNISASYLIKNKKLPVFYMSVLYSKRFISGGLFSLFLNFELDENTLKEVQDPKETEDQKQKRINDKTLTSNPRRYINRLLGGKFTIDLVTDDGFLADVLERRKPMIEDILMKKYIDEFDKAASDSSDEAQIIMDKITSETENKLDEYRRLFQPLAVDLPFVNPIMKQFKKMVKSEIFRDLIVEGLNCREKERKEKSCPDQDFKPPKKIINLKDLKEHPEKIDELVDNLSATDSSDE